MYGSLDDVTWLLDVMQSFFSILRDYRVHRRDRIASRPGAAGLGGDGRLTGHVGVVTDIDTLKRSEAVVRAAPLCDVDGNLCKWVTIDIGAT